MSGHSSRVQKVSLTALHVAGIDRFAMRLTGGSGAIFSLHHVLPAMPMAFAPNRHLEVTPEFLDRTVRLVVERGYDILSLDDARARLAEGDLDRPFVCFTFDDGYRDVVEHAYSVFQRHARPFAIYVASDFADGRGDIWWRALEHLVRTVEAIELKIDGVARSFACASLVTKSRAYAAIHRWLATLPEVEAREIVAGLCRKYEVDVGGHCAELAMGWDEIRELAHDPLVTIGAHTRRHIPLAQLSYAEARAEIEASRDRIEREIGRSCRHFSFPEGGVGPRDFVLAREAGLATALASQNGLLKPQHATSLNALPRVDLSGDLQRARYVKVLLSGLPFAFASAAGRPTAAVAPA